MSVSKPLALQIWNCFNSIYLYFCIVWWVRPRFLHCICQSNSIKWLFNWLKAQTTSWRCRSINCCKVGAHIDRYFCTKLDSGFILRIEGKRHNTDVIHCSPKYFSLPPYLPSDIVPLTSHYLSACLLPCLAISFEVCLPPSKNYFRCKILFSVCVAALPWCDCKSQNVTYTRFGLLVVCWSLIELILINTAVSVIYKITEYEMRWKIIME